MNLFLKEFEQFVMFSFEDIQTFLNEKGEEKKKLILNGLQWDKIEKTTIKPHHTSYACLTGKPSKITVVDIDNDDVYIKLLDKYPLLSDIFTVRTKNGVHLYFNYNELLKTGQNVMLNYPDVDIRNDGGFIISPPTKYKLLSGDVAEYKFLGGELLDIPNEFLEEFKIFNNQNPQRNKNNKNVIEDRNIETSKYIYEIDETQLKAILNNLDEKYLNEFQEWVKVVKTIKFMNTTASINKYKILDEWSKKNLKKYDSVGNRYHYNKQIYNKTKDKYDINCFIREINKTKDKKDKLKLINYYIPLQIDNFKIPTNYEKLEFENNYLFTGYSFDIFNRYSTQLISSDTGTGKTYSISKHFSKYKELNPDKKLLSIVSLISIADQQIKSFEKDKVNVYSYQETPIKNLLKNNLVICLNSLTKIKNISEEQLKNTVVYIDEINLFLYTLTHNENLNSNIKEIYETLIYILRNAEKVVFTDAFITEQAFILASVRKNTKNIYINNTYQKFKDVEAIFLKDENNFFKQLLVDMNDNYYYMCLCDTIEGAERIFNFLFSNATDKQKQLLKLWTSETDEIIKNTNFKIGWHITSPKIVASVDKNDTKNKTNHYIYIKGKSINPELIYQQTARNRNPDKLYYYSEAETHLNKFNNLEDVENKIKSFKLTDDKINKVCMVNDEDDNKIINMNTFYKLYVKNEFKLDVFNTNKLLHYQDILKRKGFILKSEGESKKRDDRKKVKSELLEVKQEAINEFIEKVKEEDENIYDDKNKRYNSVIELLNLSANTEFKQEYIKLFGNDEIIKNIKKNNSILEEFKAYLNDKYLLSSFYKFLTLFKSDEYIKGKLDNLAKNSYYLKYLDGVYNKVYYIRKYEKLCKIEPFEVENNVKYISIQTELKDDEWEHIKAIFRSTKPKPNNKFEALKLYKLFLNNICGEIDIFNKGVKVNNKGVQFYNYKLEKEIINKLFVLAIQNPKNSLNMDETLLKKFNVNLEFIEDVKDDDEEQEFIIKYMFGKDKK